jgi:hypothetical protein
MSFKPKLSPFLDYYQKTAGLWNDRGNYDASSNAYPITGGSGTSGAVKKGDTWLISVAGILPTGQVVGPGDTIRALLNTPGQIQSNWAILENNIGFTPENSANKSTSIVTDQASDIKFPSVKSVYDWVTTSFVTGLSFANTLHVATNGNDTTGARNNLAKPFLTLEAARDAAASGDTIFVYPGSYTVTTTDTNGLAKSGVNWFFYPGAILTKTTNGWMFSLSGLVSACNVYGKGAFYKTGGTLGIHWAGDDGAAIALDFIFEADYVQQSVVAATFSVWNNVANLARYNIRYGVASGTHLLYVAYQSNLEVDTHTLKCTAGSAIKFNSGSTYIKVNGHLLQSTTTDGVGTMYNIINGLFNVTRCIGTTYGYGTNGGSVDITVNGYTSGIAMTSGGNFNHNGTCGYLYNTAGNFKGGIVGYATVNNGTASYKADGNTNANHTIAGGVANIELPYHGYSFYLNATAGKTILWGNGYNVFTIGARIIAGGTVILNGDLEYGGTDYLGNRDVFTLNSGKLVINGRIKNLLTTQATGTCVTYNGGTLVVNAGVLLTSNTEVPPIIVGGANRNIKVLAGGLSTNRITDLLSAKKQKAKQTVQAISSTSIQLNDGVGGWEVFTVSDTVTYNTQAKIAQQMAVLINASGTLNITASQDTPGTDAYFYVESDVAGTPFTTQTVVNLTNAVIRENSYALTNTTGGVIIEDADVE